MNIYHKFLPTFLYIKRHTITGKLYFGKTTKNPETYKGSGKHWLSHIKKHGTNDIETLWYCLYNDKESIKEASLSFSKLWNIVESKEWLNMIEEDGIGNGLPPGHKKTEEWKLKKSSDNKNFRKNPNNVYNTKEYRKKLSEIQKIVQKRPNARKNLIDKLSKNWLIIDRFGTKTIIKNLNQFCRDNKLSISCMARVARGERKQHLGYIVIPQHTSVEIL